MLTMALGLCVRALPFGLPEFLAVHAGDAIWAAMIYAGIRVIKPDLRPMQSAGIGLFVCLIVELSQLYQADWISAIRSTTLGALVLGRGFLYTDLLRYTVGTVIATAADLTVKRVGRV
ncbi:ribosomal maturation YjgA family protein [Paenibacillus tarimensis]|uniref:ribosomal maturation YjgA family protein n=1 Tax=Paenibacillus tarimensis TaxID=416012 RepID=UPI001F443EB3|nr:DUF2809 domain-containing protein [Paenibacillus tarimensis]MCF2944764.1 DUF2809 domain-containing protein [Paenibacillus tarimensis]